MKKYNVIIIGAGLAGMAPLFHMNAENKLDNYINKGICIIEKSNKLGIGKFKDYNISANTLRKAFLEIFSNKKSSDFERIQKNESYIKLMGKDENSLIKLIEIGELYKDYSEIIKEKIDKNNNSDVFCRSEAIKIVKDEDGYFVQYKDLINDEVLSVFGKNIIINLGGVPKKQCKQKNTITADDLLKNDIEDKVSDLLNKNHKIVLIGNSHSAFSIVSAIRNNNNFTNNHDVYIVGRSPIRLFYENEKEAKLDGYRYNVTSDVCPFTGRVNRYTGMRGESFYLAKKIIRNQLGNIKHFLSTDVEESLYFDADLIIECIGYKSKTLPIYNLRGNRIHLAYNNEMVLVDKNFHLITSQEKTLENVFSYGLGVGIIASEEVGGEKAFKGRIDGVWLYQHYVAPKILSVIEKSN